MNARIGGWRYVHLALRTLHEASLQEIGGFGFGNGSTIHHCPYPPHTCIGDIIFGMMASRASQAHGTSSKPRPNRVVIKLGTNLVTLESGGLDESTLANLTRQAASLRHDGLELILVSSGAVGAGAGILARIGHADAVRGRRDLRSRQAAAAIGQVELITVYQRLFRTHGIDIAQALISRNDLNSRIGYLNVRNTLERLLRWHLVPIINENDVVGAVELAGVVYGDNDRLSAMLANALDADLLILLGTTQGLYTANPDVRPDAELLPRVEKITGEIMAYAKGPRDDRGSGGMRSKLEAAEVAIASGIDMVIADGYIRDVIPRIISGEQIGTRFVASDAKRTGRKRWLLTGSTEARGGVVVDAGAVTALKSYGVSLLPAGVTDVVGEFDRGDIVSVISPTGDKVAYGVANYNAQDIQTIAGLRSDEMRELLAQYHGSEVIHRDNLVMS